MRLFVLTKHTERCIMHDRKYAEDGQRNNGFDAEKAVRGSATTTLSRCRSQIQAERYHVRRRPSLTPAAVPPTRPGRLSTLRDLVPPMRATYSGITGE